MATPKLGKLLPSTICTLLRRRTLGALTGVLAASAMLAAPALAGATETLYWSHTGGVSSARLPGGSAAEAFGLTGVAGVALEPAAGKLYAADFNGEIEVRPLAGGAPSTVISEEEEGIDGIALDEAAGKIYWVNDESGAVRSASLSGGSPETLYTGAGTEPVGIAVDAKAGKLYWSEWAAHKVMVANLDGSEAHALYTGQEGPEEVRVDASTGKLYWADSKTGQIMFGTVSGEPAPAQALYTEPEGRTAEPWGVAIDPRAGKIYWTDKGSGKVMVGALAGETAAGSPSALFEGQSEPGYLALLNSPLSTAAPSIGGNPAIGSALSCSQGSWAQDQPEASFFEAPAGYSYQWLRDGTAISGATSASFTPSEGGSYLCDVSAVNQAGATVQGSAAVTVGAPVPTVTISAPASGITYMQGAVVPTTFTCAEGAGGPGLASCNDGNGTASVSGGSGHLETATLGAHTYTVTATSKDGQTGAASVTYTVVPLVTEGPPPHAQPIEVLILGGNAIVKGGHARVKLACKGGAECAGEVVLKARVRLTVKHGRHHRARMVTIVLGRASFTIHAGAHAVVSVKLSSFAKKALAQASHHRLKAKAIATVRGAKNAHRTVKLLEKAGRHAHRRRKRGHKHAP